MWKEFEPKFVLDLPFKESNSYCAIHSGNG